MVGTPRHCVKLVSDENSTIAVAIPADNYMFKVDIKNTSASVLNEDNSTIVVAFSADIYIYNYISIPFSPLKATPLPRASA